MTNYNQINGMRRVPLLVTLASSAFWLFTAPGVRAQASWHMYSYGYVQSSKSTGGHPNAFAVSVANGSGPGGSYSQATGSMTTRLYPSAANRAQSATTQCTLGVAFNAQWQTPDGSFGGYPMKGVTVNQTYFWDASAMAYTGANASGSGDVDISNTGAPGNGENSVGCPAGNGLSNDLTADEPNDPVKAAGAFGFPNPSNNSSNQGITQSEFGAALHTKNIFVGTANQPYSVDMGVGSSIYTIHYSADAFNKYGMGFSDFSPDTVPVKITSSASPPSAGNGTAAANGDYMGFLCVSLQSDN